MNGCVTIVSMLLWLIVTALFVQRLALRKSSVFCIDKQAVFVRNIHADAVVTARQKCNANSRGVAPHAEMTCIACRLTISAEQVCTMHNMHMHCSLLLVCTMHYTHMHCSLLKIKLGLSC